MSELHCDALVFFGATGDLAYKKIFPAAPGHGPPRPSECASDRRVPGRLDLDQLKRAGGKRQRREARRPPTRRRSPSCPRSACAYVDGDYKLIPPPSRHCAQELGSAQHPAHYLAIPPLRLFGAVVEQLGKSGCARALASSSKSRSARTSPRHRPSTVPCLATSTRRRSIASTITLAKSRCRTCCISASPTRSWSRSGTASSSRVSRSRWRRRSACRAAARF